MPIFQFSKLVRDKIVDNQIAAGIKPRYRQLSPVEHKRELINKLIEEAREVESASIDEAAEEIADLQQVIDDLRGLYGLDASAIAAAQAAKNKKNGAFTQGIYIEDVNLDETNEWVSYYRKHPDRYPEL